jgi:hypothetical protein
MTMDYYFQIKEIKLIIKLQGKHFHGEVIVL